MHWNMGLRRESVRIDRLAKRRDARALSNLRWNTIFKVPRRCRRWQCKEELCFRGRNQTIKRTLFTLEPRPDALRGDREKPGAERIAILGLGPGDYRGACLLCQVETMF